LKVYLNINAFSTNRKTAVTTGTFDGVHKGHRVVIDQLIRAAKKIDGESVLLTFFPHPRMIVQPDDNDLRLLNTIEERISLLEKSGIDHLIVHPFSKEFSRLSSTEYIRDILVNQLNLSTLVIGYDHQFGRNREGSFKDLIELAPLYNFQVEEIPAQEIQHINVSSTKVRNSLLAGEINAANQFLGYTYFLKGKVIAGKKIGRSIGFPTANVEVNEWYKLIPTKGVYAVKIKLEDKTYNGMLNLGSRPTIIDNSDDTIEVNIFDFNADIYNKDIVIQFYERIRDEQKFKDIAELQNQLDKDKKIIKNFFNT
jgi:riboflavin kinase/FMN adenylyltransferase